MYHLTKFWFLVCGACSVASYLYGRWSERRAQHRLTEKSS